MTYSKKEIAQKLGLMMPSNRVNYKSLKAFFEEKGVLSALNMTVDQYNQRRRRFNIVESQVIEQKLLS